MLRPSESASESSALRHPAHRYGPAESLRRAQARVPMRRRIRYAGSSAIMASHQPRGVLMNSGGLEVHRRIRWPTENNGRSPSDEVDLRYPPDRDFKVFQLFPLRGFQRGACLHQHDFEIVEKNPASRARARSASAIKVPRPGPRFDQPLALRLSLVVPDLARTIDPSISPKVWLISGAVMNSLAGPNGSRAAHRRYWLRPRTRRWKIGPCAAISAAMLASSSVHRRFGQLSTTKAR